jgi:predicted DNA-binding protein
MASVVTSVRLTLEEKQALDNLAREYGYTVNSMLRICVLKMAGLPVPSRFTK